MSSVALPRHATAGTYVDASRKSTGRAASSFSAAGADDGADAATCRLFVCVLQLRLLDPPLLLLLPVTVLSIISKLLLLTIRGCASSEAQLLSLSSSSMAIAYGHDLACN